MISCHARSLIFVTVVIAVHAVRADTLWTENAENGYTYVLDHTSSDYSLIQSEIVGQGGYAFHLANPNFQDNWFEIDQTIPVQADTKLFMLSRLTYATTAQIARVQISTDGGSTWPTNISSQPGSDGPGEGAFSLQEFDLSAYANQSLRFRFFYDFTGGSAYTQVDPGVGWYVDDIQIGDQLQKSQYSIGNPSAYEQLYLEYINRSRSDALAEAARLANETDTDVTSAYSFFGITGPNIVNQFEWYVNNGAIDRYAQPLAFNAALNLAADLHTQDMYDHQFQGHNNSPDPPTPLVPNGDLGSRLDAVGYTGGAGENVYSNASSVVDGHASLDVDWGNVSNPADPYYNPSFAGQGMQNPAGHRINLHNGDFKEIGIGVINGTNGSVGPQLVTEDLGDPGAATFITGVVYEDLNANNFYDIGEGRSGVRIDVDGSAYYAVSTESGGYSVPVVGDGAYDILFSGGGYADFSTMVTIAGGWNAKVDYLVSSITYAADFDHDGDVDDGDLALWQSAYNSTATGDADGDGDTDRNDFLIWQREFASGADTVGSQMAIPEPASVALLIVAGVCGIFHCHLRPARLAIRSLGGLRFTCL